LQDCNWCILKKRYSKFRWEEQNQMGNWLSSFLSRPDSRYNAGNRPIWSKCRCNSNNVLIQISFDNRSSTVTDSWNLSPAICSPSGQDAQTAIPFSTDWYRKRRLITQYDVSIRKYSIIRNTSWRMVCMMKCNSFNVLGKCRQQGQSWL